jgi:hypothetical protein
MRKALILLLLLALLPAATVLAQEGGPYRLDWSTIDGGGGFSQGGDYALWGAAGQPDAGLLAGGDYGLSGGFWGGLYLPPEPAHRIYLPLVLRDGP